MTDIPIYTLLRLGDDGTETWGKIISPDNSFLACTIELPWLNNQHDVSCIPPGKYLFYKYNSPTKGWVWRTDDAAPRTAIEIHAANFAHQLLGCIGVGNAMGEILGQDAVLNSKETMEMLYSKLPDTFYLNIIAPNA